MSAQIIDGAAIAKKLRQDIAAEVKAAKLTPGLAVVLVGEDPASQVYVRNKGKAAEEVGMKSWTHRMPAKTTQAQLLAMVDKLNNDPQVHGILVQLPLPKHMYAPAIIEAIDPSKDVDGFHPVNVGKLNLGISTCFAPCTPLGCMLLIRETEKNLAGKKAIVLGRSNIVGRPVAQLLLQADCTVTIAHSRTKDLAAECHRADIVVAAIGKPNFVASNWIKPGAIVVDVGINRIDDPANPGKTKLVGDVDFAAASAVAGAITPVPGGVGPMTIACLLKNTLQSAVEKAALSAPAQAALA